jgi:hypothetical protein
MAKKRMFSLDVVDLDSFIEMPVSAKLLYYALEVLRNSSYAICISLDEMKIRLKNMFENKVEGNMGVE